MKKSILEIYALAVCFVALACFVIALGIGVYDLIQIANPVFTINAYEYDRHQSNEAFRRFPGLYGMVGPRHLAFGSGGTTGDYENDRYWKNLLVTWDANSLFDFSFYDTSVDVSVDSTDAAAIKRAISARINNATYFLFLRPRVFLDT